MINKIINIAILFLTITSFQLFGQDSTKKSLDTAYKPLKFILSDYRNSYINQNDPDTITRRRILWHPLKTIDDLFNYLPGYYLRFMDVGQINQLMYNQMDNYSTAVLRNGRLINDMLDGSIDLNMLSRNEIAEIELNNGYGNTVYNYPNAVNVIQRQLFQFRPYTEISYFQDRYENLYFDGDFHQNFFRNLNFNFGITKHSYDGHYKNSDFDKWLGRFNLNFAASGKLNMFAYVNYSVIKRGLNEGLNPDTVDLSNKEEVFNTTLALPQFQRSHERKERFDIDAGAVYQAGKLSFTKLQFYESNSFREYYQTVNLSNPSSPLSRDVYHWINYGIKAVQLFSFDLKKDISVVSKSELEYSNLRIQIDQAMTSPSNYFRNNKLSYLEDVSVKYKNFTAGAYVKGYTPCYAGGKFFDCFVYKAGAKASYEHKLNESSKLRFSAMVSNYYYSGGVDFISDICKFGLTYYNNDYSGYVRNLIVLIPVSENFRGINAVMNLKVFKFVLDINHSYNFRNDLNETMPENSGRIDLSFDDIAFRKKLEYKIGLTSRYWSKHDAVYYSAELNRFDDYYFSYNPFTYGIRKGTIPENFTLDFFIIGKIGKATFGLTLENILNRLVYNTGVYPFMDRGGFLNTISRFNITWNFFD